MTAEHDEPKDAECSGCLLCTRPVPTGELVDECPGCAVCDSSDDDDEPSASG